MPVRHHTLRAPTFNPAPNCPAANPTRQQGNGHRFTSLPSTHGSLVARASSILKSRPVRRDRRSPRQFGGLTTDMSITARLIGEGIEDSEGSGPELDCEPGDVAGSPCMWSWRSSPLVGGPCASPDSHRVEVR